MSHIDTGAPFTPARVMPAARTDTNMRGVMNLRVGQRRALHSIEQDLAASDPRLGALFFAFTEQFSGEKMPRAEKIKSRPLRLLARSGRPGRRRAGADWSAWPRAIP